MMKKSNKDFSQQYRIIYDIFLAQYAQKNIKPTLRGFCDFLNISLGKRQAWEQGQWPSAEDLEVLHDKMHFSYQWLVSGKGDAVEKEQPTPQPAVQSDEVTRLLSELEEERRLNRQLVTRLLVDGTGDKDASKNTTGKAADGQ